MSIRLGGGAAKGLRVPSAKASGTRPTSSLVRNAVFSILGEHVQDTHVLDLYAGTGAIGMEALSRGAAWVDFVESNNRQCGAIKDALKSLGFEHAAVYNTKVERAITILEGPYDLIIMDPPYEMEGVETTIERLAGSRLVGPGTLLILEHSTHHPVRDMFGSLNLAKRRRYGDTVISIYQQGNM